MSLVAGVDCSTQSTTVAVVDTATATVVARSSHPHVVSGSGGARETDPVEWEEALGAALAATGRAGDLAALSIAGQQHGLVVADHLGRPLRPAMLWNDTRSAAEARALVEALGGPDRTARQIGSVPTAAFTASKWAWLRRHEPETAERTRSIRLPHDHLNAVLTGVATTDRSDVSGTGWWGPVQEGYLEQVLGLPAIDLDPALLPTVTPPDGTAGTVGRAAAERFGLTAGIPVACGAGDNAAAGLALALQPGELAMSLGTSGTVFTVSDAPTADPTGIVAGFASADGRYLPLACTLNATLAVDRTASWLGLPRDQVEPSDGVVYLPWFDGERTPNLPAATGALWGLRHTTTPGAILQAAYEGLVATLLFAADRLPSPGAGTAGAKGDESAATPILLTGGGARGGPWREAVSRLSGRPVIVPEQQDLVALGAAIQAAAVLEGEPPARVATQWHNRQGLSIDPVAADHDTLARIGVWAETATRYANDQLSRMEQ